MQNIRIGRASGAANIGDRVQVKFEDGSSGYFTAETDILSTEVAVLGDRAFDGSAVTNRVDRDTNFFKSKSSFETGGDRWAYLFNVYESEDTIIPFTNPTYAFSSHDFAIYPMGNGQGEFTSAAEALDRFDNPILGDENNPGGDNRPDTPDTRVRETHPFSPKVFKAILPDGRRGFRVNYGALTMQEAYLTSNTAGNGNPLYLGVGGNIPGLFIQFTPLGTAISQGNWTPFIPARSLDPDGYYRTDSDPATGTFSPNTNPFLPNGAGNLYLYEYLMLHSPNEIIANTNRGITITPNLDGLAYLRYRNNVFTGFTLVPNYYLELPNSRLIKRSVLPENIVVDYANQQDFYFIEEETIGFPPVDFIDGIGSDPTNVSNEPIAEVDDFAAWKRHVYRARNVDSDVNETVDQRIALPAGIRYFDVGEDDFVTMTEGYLEFSAITRWNEVYKVGIRVDLVSPVTPDTSSTTAYFNTIDDSSLRNLFSADMSSYNILVSFLLQAKQEFETFFTNGFVGMSEPSNIAPGLYNFSQFTQPPFTERNYTPFYRGAPTPFVFGDVDFNSYDLRLESALIRGGLGSTPETRYILDNYVNDAGSSHVLFRYSIFKPVEIYPRAKGKRQIYCQVMNTEPVLLKEIPKTEEYDSFISPIIGSSQVEVVIKTGKKQSEINPNILPGSHPNNNFYDREWSVVDVYQISLSGEILDHQTFNGGAILVTEDNWQKPWLEQYSDYRSFPGVTSHDQPFYQFGIRDTARFPEYPVMPAYDPEEEFDPIYSSVRLEATKFNYNGLPEDLVSAYRVFFGDRYTLHGCSRFTHDQEFYARNSYHVSRRFARYGTLTPSGFVFVEPS